MGGCGAAAFSSLSDELLISRVARLAEFSPLAAKVRPPEIKSKLLYALYSYTYTHLSLSSKCGDAFSSRHPAVYLGGLFHHPFPTHLFTGAEKRFKVNKNRTSSEQKKSVKKMKSSSNSSITISSMHFFLVYLYTLKSLVRNGKPAMLYKINNK